MRDAPYRVYASRSFRYVFIPRPLRSTRRLAFIILKMKNRQLGEISIPRHRGIEALNFTLSSSSLIVAYIYTVDTHQEAPFVPNLTRSQRAPNSETISSRNRLQAGQRKITRRIESSFVIRAGLDSCPGFVSRDTDLIHTDGSAML
jgi:hypothetical protein